MKIKNVEIPRHQPSEDGTNSTGSISAELLMDSNIMVANDPELEQSIKTLSVALTELHAELQDKSTECEALLATVTALSNALKESDQRCEEKALECERLQLKLQMVSFMERGDTLPDPLGIYQDEDEPSEEKNSLKPEIPKKKTTRKTVSTATPATSTPATSTSSVSPALLGKSVRPKKEKPVDSSTDTIEKAVATEKKSAEPASGPVSVDDEMDERDVPCEGPRQAHFYRVISERDKALVTVKKLSKELKHAKAKVKELKSRVERSTALVEISYEDESKDDATSHASTADRPGIKSMSWLRKGGRTVRKEKGSSTDADETFVTFVTEEEMLPSRWNSKEIKSEEDYLKAIASNDADRAGGFQKVADGQVESIRFQL